MTSAREACDFVVVTPVYNDQESLKRLLQVLHDTFGARVQAVMVDDGSLQNPVQPEEVAAVGVHGHVLRLIKNTSSQGALAVGLWYAATHFSGHKVVCMDSDGEDRPQSIPQLLRALEAPDVDCAVAVRKSRINSWIFKVFYVLYKIIFRLFSGQTLNFGNFMALKPHAVRRITHMRALWVHAAATIIVSGLRYQGCPIERGARYSGESRMNFSALALHGLRGLMVCAEHVQLRIGSACFIVALLSTMGIVLSVIFKVSGLATPGWFSIALGLMVLMVLQTGMMTLISLMLSRTTYGPDLPEQDMERLIESVHIVP